MAVDALRITEIFYSLQGESSTVGLPTVFVRLTGCPLRCVYCDSAYAFSGGQMLALDMILDQVARYSPRYVTVTGGEPLAQPGCITLLKQLCDQGYQVSIETSGALPIEAIDARVSIVMDLKTPDSGEQDKNLLSNLEFLSAKDQIKFVIASERDYQWSRQMLQEHALEQRVGEVLFSPSYEELPPVKLAEWILKDRLKVRFQMQIHKLLWNDEPGH